MTDQQLQWLLSLSLVSYLGPEMDVDALTLKGFYRRIKPDVQYLDIAIALDQKPYKNHDKAIAKFMKLWSITNQASYKGAVEALLAGSELGHNVYRMIEIGRLLTTEANQQPQIFTVNRHPYPYEFFREVMAVEAYMPLQGFLAYDLANLMMLLRLGVGYKYITEKEQKHYFDQIMEQGTGNYSSYKQFGSDATFCKHLHKVHLEGCTQVNLDQAIDVQFATAYYSVWQWFESLNLQFFI